MRIHELSAAWQEELIRAAYEQVYLPAFPIPEEREPVETWLAALARPDGDCRVLVTVLGEGLSRPQQRRIDGIGVCNFFPRSGTGLLAYNAVRKSMRGKGLGRRLVKMRAEGLLDMAAHLGVPLNGIFLECNDPARVPTRKDSMDPARRLRIFKRWGARQIRLDYVQPALGPGQAPCRDLCLLVYPHPQSGTVPRAESIAGFIADLYRSCGAATVNNPDYTRMMDQLGCLPVR